MPLPGFEGLLHSRPLAWWELPDHEESKLMQGRGQGLMLRRLALMLTPSQQQACAAQQLHEASHSHQRPLTIHFKLPEHKLLL